MGLPSDPATTHAAGVMPFDADVALAKLDALIGVQLDAIMHHPTLMRLERAWRSLAFVVKRVEFRENITVDFVQCTREDLLVDFDVSSEDGESSALRKWLAARDYAVVAVDCELEGMRDDVMFVDRCARVAAREHVLVLVGARPVPEPYARLRDTQYISHVGLCWPPFLLRAPYRGDGDLRYDEHAPEVAERLWCGAQFALAERIAASFARLRHGGGCTGDDAMFPGLPQAELAPQTMMALNAGGFAVLSRAGQAGHLTFQSAPSLGAMCLPNLVLIMRFAHYLKVIARDWEPLKYEAKGAEHELEKWIGHYRADAHLVSGAIRGRRPLRGAKVVVTEHEGACSFRLRLRFHQGPQSLETIGALPYMASPSRSGERPPSPPERAGPSVVDRDALTAARERIGHLVLPIDGGAGQDISYDERFEEIKYEVEKLASLSGESIHWSSVEVFAEELLTESSRDFRVACHWATSTWHVNGTVESALDGAVLLETLAATCWSDMFPPARRMRARMAMVAWWSDNTGPSLMRRAVSSRDAPTVMALDDITRTLDGRLSDLGGEGYLGMAAMLDAVRHLMSSLAQAEEH